MTIHLNATERPLSPTEQTVWSADDTCSMNFSMHFELRGPLTEAHLRDALLQAQNRHPLLRMRIADEGKQVWFRSSGIGSLPLRIVDGPPERLTEEAEHEVRTGFDWRQGPLARCVWIRHAPDHGTLLITFHHVIGDGISGSFLVRDILRALAGEKLTPLPLAESLDGHLPAKARGLRAFIGYARILAHFIGWILRKGMPKAVPAESNAGFAGRRANLVLMRFDPLFTEALAARARAEGTTVHGALSAAIVLSGFPEMKVARAHFAFGSPLNMRDRFEPPIGEDIGFYVAMGVSSHIIQKGQDFWSLARDLKQGLTSAVDMGMPFYGLTGLAPALMFLSKLFGGGTRGMRAAAGGWAALMTEAFGLTNIGRVKVEPRYGPYQVSALGFVASISVLGSNVFTASTLDNVLCLNHIAMEPLIPRETQRRVSERTRAILEAALLSPSVAQPAMLVNA